MEGSLPKVFGRSAIRRRWFARGVQLSTGGGGAGGVGLQLRRLSGSLVGGEVIAAKREALLFGKKKGALRNANLRPQNASGEVELKLWLGRSNVAIDVRSCEQGSGRKLIR